MRGVCAPAILAGHSGRWMTLLTARQRIGYLKQEQSESPSYATKASMYVGQVGDVVGYIGQHRLNTPDTRRKIGFRVAETRRRAEASERRAVDCVIRRAEVRGHRYQRQPP